MFGSYTADQWLEYFAKANDGGYILVGWGLDTDQDQQAWIIKTDSLGCDGYQSCQDTALAMHVLPHQATLISGNGISIKTFIDNGKGPVTVSYSTGDVHYPVYLSFPGATDSLVFAPTHDTVVYVTAHYGNTPGVVDSTVIHIIAGINKQNLKDWFKINPNPAKDLIYIERKNYSDSEILDIINSHGICVLAKTLSGGIENFKVSLIDIPAGVYYVRIGNCFKKLVIFK